MSALRRVMSALRRRYGSNADLADAIRAMRFLFGGVNYVGMNFERRLYLRAQRLVGRAAKRRGLIASDLWAQTAAEATRQGMLRPTPQDLRAVRGESDS